jgi:hypothetical protein
LRLVKLPSVQVHSVDLVDGPGTVGGLFEQHDDSGDDASDRLLLRDVWPDDDSDDREQLREQANALFGDSGAEQLQKRMTALRAAVVFGPPPDANRDRLRELAGRLFFDDSGASPERAYRPTDLKQLAARVFAGD